MENFFEKTHIFNSAFQIANVFFFLKAEKTQLFECCIFLFMDY